jgi:catechol-2,3-dioxygenase
VPIALDRIDHVHVFVTNRAEAETWYATVLDLHRDPTLEFWSAEGGPLMLKNASGSVKLALFEQPAQPTRSIIAFNAAAPDFADWLRHLEQHLQSELVDHHASWSVYFADPDGNPFEITCYDRTIELRRNRT